MLDKYLESFITLAALVYFLKKARYKILTDGLNDQ